MAHAPAVATTDRRRLRGQHTRQAILSHASRLASAEGLEAVSLQRLASGLGISKSGLFAHFGSKEELQLAVVEEAGKVFTDEVLRPGLKAPAGLGRVGSLCDAYLSYLQRAVFPGGCFFEAAVAEFDNRPGPVRDAVVQKRNYWMQSLARTIHDAVKAGDVQPGTDADQLAWELMCLMVGANGSCVMDRADEGIGRARRAIRNRLAGIATASANTLPE